MPQPEEAVATASVVIPVRFGESTLGDQLDTLAAQADAPPFEVIVVDNGAEWDVGAVLAQHPPGAPACVVVARDRRGFSTSRNRGIAASSAPYIICLDDDDVVSDRYVGEICVALAAQPFVAARIDLGRLNPGWRMQVRGIPQTVGLGTSTFPWAYGGTLAFRREVFDAVGGFDASRDRSTGEDIDFCRRASAVGYELQFVPNAVLHYRLRHTYWGLWRQGVRSGRSEAGLAGARNRLRSVPGALRLLAFGPGKGMRRRGAFGLGRFAGTLIPTRRQERPAVREGDP